MTGWHTLLGALFGLGATLLPDIVQMLKDRFAHGRALERQEQSIAAAKEGVIVPTVAPAVTEPVTVDVPCQVFITCLKSSVRPVVTYLFFALFTVVKCISLYHAYHTEHLSVVQALPVLWDDETETLFSAIIAFWFGSRSLGKGSTTNVSTGTQDSDSEEVRGSGQVVGE